MCMGMNNYREPKEEKKMSLLKPYTNNDRINDMSIDEKAEFLNTVLEGTIEITNGCLSERCKAEHCNGCIKQWLESEVTE